MRGGTFNARKHRVLGVTVYDLFWFGRKQLTVLDATLANGFTGTRARNAGEASQWAGRKK